ncbi:MULTISPECIES: hypothetical protein [unclassified Methanoregula]|uniref:hypothetical protein n=1 Tax=unclassified Methanoregula TaxID=2649730 RepID=UPI0009D2ED4F|nr:MULTISPECIES: hypothetical protein [unclassified Methanoregula]OPX64008.1 MAG: hypothetical protein A4E33_01029 [Methanoregula sp. PtaB.Bin085]OPY33794.1 MAG: hypothetical protein A4E34_01734 [Methanoregula sp. PtaU1.Bin006]
MREGTEALFGTCAIALALALAAAGCISPGTNPPVSVQATENATPNHPPHYLPLFFDSLYSMQERLAPSVTLSLPTRLPEGYVFTTGTQTGGYGETSADQASYTLSYQRGQKESIYLQEQSRNSTTCPDEPVYKTAAVGKTLTQREGTGELTWGRDGWCFTLSGPVPKNELEAIAASVQPIPYRQGVMPPYEYQPPAHPLVGTFPVNRSATAAGQTITIRTFSCTADACTAVFHIHTLSPADPPPSQVVTTMPPIGSGPRAEWRVDGGRPLLTKPGGGMRYNETSVFWMTEPLPKDSRELVVNFTRINGIDGVWRITIPLDGLQTSREPQPNRQEAAL